MHVYESQNQMVHNVNLQQQRTTSMRSSTYHSLPTCAKELLVLTTAAAAYLISALAAWATSIGCTANSTTGMQLRGSGDGGVDLRLLVPYVVVEMEPLGKAQSVKQ